MGIDVSGLYIHIPFCVKKCGYCDFDSYLYEENMADRYVDALKKEIYIHLNDSPIIDSKIMSIFFGGGTPTILKIRQLTDILKLCRDSFSLSGDCEITIEANPGTITQNGLVSLRKQGFNRLSLGIQSFSNRLLKEIGRVHNTDDIYRSISWARREGFRNISFDLIFGLPGQTMNEWKDTLLKAIDLKPMHLSTYNLTIEEGTPFYYEFKNGRLPLPPEDVQVEMYETGIQILKDADFEHYEISSFARPGWRCRHNQIYWRNKEYLGIGAGAASYIDGYRYRNKGNPEDYIEDVTAGKLPLEGETLKNETLIDKKRIMGEYIMLGLRMLDGINLNRFEEYFGIRALDVYHSVIPRLIKERFLLLEDNSLKLTHHGIIFSDQVFQDFL